MASQCDCQVATGRKYLRRRGWQGSTASGLQGGSNSAVATGREQPGGASSGLPARHDGPRRRTMERYSYRVYFTIPPSWVSREGSVFPLPG